MPYKAGGFYFPTGTGTFKLDTEFEVQGGLFFGTNQSVEDAVITVPYPAVFFGMAWRDLGGGVDGQSISNSMTVGVGVRSVPISCVRTTGSVEDYRGEIVSFDADGITLNATIAAPGPRLIHYLLWGEMDGANGTASNSGTFTVPYRPLTGIGMNFRTASGTRDAAADNETSTFWCGGANWPDEEDLTVPTHENRTWASGGFCRIHTVGFNGLVDARANTLPSPQEQSLINTMTGDGLLTIDQEFLYMWRNASGQIQISATGGPFRYFGQWWTSEGYANFCGVSDTLGGTSTFVSPLDQIDAGWFIGVMGEGEAGLGTQNRITIGVITPGPEDGGPPEYQGCIASTHMGGGKLYQSQNTCVVKRLDPDTDGITAASGVIDGNEIILTTEIASGGSAPSPVALVYHDELLHQQFFRIY